jgi:U4/U6 small nuclear ribonucleoprotein PRP4
MENVEDQHKEVFYTEGTAELQQARLDIAKFSIPRAQKRLMVEKERRQKIIEQ